MKKKKGRRIKTRYLQRLANAAEIHIDWSMTLEQIQVEIKKARHNCRRAYMNDKALRANKPQKISNVNS